jgi:hypothetical protein
MEVSQSARGGKLSQPNGAVGFRHYLVGDPEHYVGHTDPFATQKWDTHGEETCSRISVHWSLACLLVSKYFLQTETHFLNVFAWIFSRKVHIVHMIVLSTFFYDFTVIARMTGNLGSLMTNEGGDACAYPIYKSYKKNRFCVSPWHWCSFMWDFRHLGISDGHTGYVSRSGRLYFRLNRFPIPLIYEIRALRILVTKTESCRIPSSPVCCRANCIWDMLFWVQMLSSWWVWYLRCSRTCFLQ